MTRVKDWKPYIFSLVEFFALYRFLLRIVLDLSKN